jgi:hypothetical protein
VILLERITPEFCVSLRSGNGGVYDFCRFCGDTSNSHAIPKIA